MKAEISFYFRGFGPEVSSQISHNVDCQQLCEIVVRSKERSRFFVLVKNLEEDNTDFVERCRKFAGKVRRTLSVIKGEN